MIRSTRREILTASLLLPSAAAAASPGKSLVVYFSRSGFTRVIAGRIHRALGADLFEIAPGRPYPEDYFETVEQARQERNQGYEPALKAMASGMANYNTVFLGFPIWGETAPPVIRSFLSSHELAGKVLIPFITHGGYGLGNSLAVVRAHAPQAELRPGFTLEGPQERQTVERVTSWLDGLKIDN